MDPVESLGDQLRVARPRIRVVVAQERMAPLPRPGERNQFQVFPDYPSRSQTGAEKKQVSYCLKKAREDVNV
jgi:hypothetical protein